MINAGAHQINLTSADINLCYTLQSFISQWRSLDCPGWWATASPWHPRPWPRPRTSGTTSPGTSGAASPVIRLGGREQSARPEYSCQLTLGLNRGGGVRSLRASLDLLRTILEWMAQLTQ